jgi:hypothetical protein
MKVLFTGTAGIQKSRVLTNLQKAFWELQQSANTPKKDFLRTPIFTLPKESHAPILDHKLYKGNITQFLAQSQRDQRRLWREAFDEINKEFAGARREHHFLGVHLTFRFEEMLWSPVDMDRLVRWAPHLVITLIDDAYCVRQRVHDGGYKAFTLSELVGWRYEENSAADHLCRLINPKKPPPNYILSVKQSALTLLRLLLKHKQTVRLYLSYNISLTRRAEETRQATNNFRRKMHNEMTHCAAFDPLAIDELPIISQPVETHLESLPEVIPGPDDKGEYKFPPSVKKHVNYDSAKKLLTYKRLMSRTERDILKGLAEDPAYKVAIDKLFEPDPPFLEFNPATNPNHRWPLLDPESALLPDNDLHNKYPAKIPYYELRNVSNALHGQVKNRDFRLIDQAHYLVIYRPTITGDPRLSEGVEAEYLYAKASGCPIVWYVNKAEDPPPESPFTKDFGNEPNYIYEPNEEPFWTAIKKLKPDPKRDSFLA